MEKTALKPSKRPWYILHTLLHRSPGHFIGDKFHRVEENAEILASCGDLVTGEGRTERKS